MSSLVPSKKYKNAIKFMSGPPFNPPILHLNFILFVVIAASEIHHHQCEQPRIVRRFVRYKRAYRKTNSGAWRSGQ